jgi:hypothetical protein
MTPEEYADMVRKWRQDKYEEYIEELTKREWLKKSYKDEEEEE